MTHYLNIEALNGEATGGWSNALWVGGNSIPLDLGSPESFIILRDGIDGYSGITSEYTDEASPNRMRHIIRQTAYTPREFGFDVLIVGSCRDDILRKRQLLLDAFSPTRGAGTLYKQVPGIGVVSITCRPVRGYPDIRDGLAPGAQARSQVATIRLTAADPYFYGGTVRVTASGGVCTVVNAGNAELTPCRIKLSADTCSNTTTGQTMTARSGQTVTGAEVDIKDSGVTAELDGANVLGRFSYDSCFPALAPGENLITGAEWVEYRPRWGGI